LFTARFGKRHQQGDMPFGLVTKAAIGRVELRFIVLRLDEVRATGFGVPESFDAVDGFLTAHSWVSIAACLGARRAFIPATCAGKMPALPDVIYISWRLASALCIVTSSAYSRSEPTGTPIAMRVVRIPSGLSSLDK